MKKSFITGAFILIIMIGCKKFPDLGSGYKFDYSGRSNYILIENIDDEVVIFDNIINYKYDVHFIVAEQKPPDSIPDGKDYEEWKIAYEKSNFKQYWIIDKKQKSVFNEGTKSYSNVYGPLTKDEYLDKLKQLNASKDLKL